MANNNFDLQDWLTGWLYGMVGRFMLVKNVPIPIAYSYNGTVLPKLPEWDKETYPYAVIYEFGDGTGKYLFVMTEPPITYGYSFMGGYRVELSDGAFGKFVAGPHDAEWHNDGWYGTEAVGNCHVDEVLWSNTDIYYHDGASDGLAGTLLIAASEPVPIDSADNLVKLEDKGSCSYNGTAYPVLPESPYWDRTTHPYAYIYTFTEDTVKLVVADKPLGFYYHSSLGYALSAGTSTDNISFNNILYVYDKTEDKNYFRFASASDLTRCTVYYSDIVWSNTDVYNTDKDTGEVTLVLEASEPVPVYE